MRHFSPKKKPLLPDTIEIDIDRFSHDGRGIGNYQGRVVMVSDALPGEHCVVKVEQGNSKLWQGKAISFKQPSSVRVKPNCAIYAKCGGCQQQHIQHKTQIELKQNTIREQFSRQQLVPGELAPPLMSNPFEYRHRARFHIAANGAIGFHEQKGHKVVDVKHCDVLVPSLQRAFSVLRDNGELQHIEQIELVADDRDQIGLAVLKGKKTAITQLEAWAQDQGWVINGCLTYDSGPLQVLAKPGDFTQVNRPINAQMITQIAAWLAPKPNDKLLDLFCGNGNIGLALAAKVSGVLGYESSASAIELAKRASEAIQGVRFGVENLFTADLHQLSEVLHFAPSLVVLDPPRAGAEHVCKTLSLLPSVHRVLYVSCDPATMARDIRLLVDDKWHLSKVGLIDMFPQTRHIETMALLEK